VLWRLMSVLGHERKSGASNGTSAFLPKTDIQASSPHVGKVPEADIAARASAAQGRETESLPCGGISVRQITI